MRRSSVPLWSKVWLILVVVSVLVEPVVDGTLVGVGEVDVNVPAACRGGGVREGK